MSKHFTLPTDLEGQPYTPVGSYSWLTEEYRSNLARQYDCAPGEIEYRLDARDRMDAYIAERREYDDPYGYARGKF